MPLLGDIEIWVKDESIDYPVQTSTHPIESGSNITDYVKADAPTLNLTGEIVGPTAEDMAEKIRNYQLQGFLLTYVGRNIFPDAMIDSFSTTHHNRIVGGYEFTMTLRAVRIARDTYLSGLYEGDLSVLVTGGDGSQQVIQMSDKQQRFHAVQTGETLWYIAGQYKSKGVSVDALIAANLDRNIFRPGHQGDFDYLLPSAQILLGEW